jgi:hypothetical protein
VREAAEPFVSKLFPRGTKLLRTEPLKAMVIGAFVRGLSMRDVESLCEQAGLGKLSKSTASRICTELRERFDAFGRRDRYAIARAEAMRGKRGTAGQCAHALPMYRPGPGDAWRRGSSASWQERRTRRPRRSLAGEGGRGVMSRSSAPCRFVASLAGLGRLARSKASACAVVAR